VVSDVAEMMGLGEALPLGQPRSEGLPSGLRAIVERAQRGDAAAFGEIVVLHQRRVVATAWRMLGNQADALDAAQEVFLRLHRYLRSFRSDQDFAGWLYRLIVNACHDTRSRRSPHLSLEEERERGSLDHLRSADDVEAAAIVLEGERLVIEALGTLSEKERAALVLRDLEGLPTEEVARVLGSSATTVRSQISSARAKLRSFRARALGEGAAR
jgi:RNA polymerase sigma-70 factor (ECF subfamily)